MNITTFRYFKQTYKNKYNEKFKNQQHHRKTHRNLSEFIRLTAFEPTRRTAWD